MKDKATWSTDELANQLTERFGPLLTQTQLAELLGRTTGGLRYSLCMPSDARTRALKSCGRKIGRRVYYPAVEVARIITATDG
ncbi:MAG: plasmid-related protein [Gammaproteobacteria bacterium]|jgi:hypothetical protein|nr:plasmid-related protein [Gammaproteobacteria bacterium]|tara:strand:+ start:3123 stop:3371 length:249 start_codon:yes stop_codon:yes gene_type:complete